MAKTSTGSAKARAAWMVAALVAVVGTVAAFLAPQLVRGRALATASARAESLVVDGLGSKLEKSDVNAAIDDKRYAEIDSYLDGLIGPGFPVLEVTVWRGDGTVAFSTESSLLQRRFPGEIPVIRRTVEHSRYDVMLADEKRKDPTPFTRALLDTHAPLRLGTTDPVTVVVEVVQDYATVVANVQSLAQPVTIAFGAASLLCVVILVMFGIMQAREQASRRIPSVVRSTPSWVRSKSVQPAEPPAVGVNTLMQRLQARIQESAQKRMEAEDKARGAEDKARAAEERARMLEA